MIAKISMSFFLVSLHIHASTWYVDNAAGAGSRNGTTWANAWTNLNGMTGLAAGDTVFISGGTTTKTYLDPLWSPASGVDGNPITYQIGQDAGHNGKAIFDQVNSTSWVKGLAALKWAVFDGGYNGQNHIIVSNCLPHYWSVHVDGGSFLTFKNIDTYNAWKFAPGTNITIMDCLIKPPPPTVSLPGYCLSWDVRGVTASHTNNLLLRNTFIAPIATTHPEWGSDCVQQGRSSVVASNYFSTYTPGTKDTEWQHTDGWQPSVTNNSNVRVFGNTFENIANYALYWESQGNTSNVWIYNNVFRMTNSTAAAENCVGLVLVFQAVNGFVFSNNIVANNTFFDYYTYTANSFGATNRSNTYLDCIFANNLAINSGDVLAMFVGNSNGLSGIQNSHNWAIAMSSGKTNINLPQTSLPTGGTNIQFVPSYVALSGNNAGILASDDTAAKDQGTNLSAWFTLDRLGNTRPATWDIGAFEYVAPATVGARLGPGKAVGAGRR